MMYSSLILLMLISPSVLLSAFVDTDDTQDKFDALDYLEKTGYLDDTEDAHRGSHAPDDVKRAIGEFQQFVGVRKTQRLNKETVAKMKQPRCGLPDVTKPSQRIIKEQVESFAPQPYKVFQAKWQTNDITYRFINFTRKMTPNNVRLAISKSFMKWAAVTPLNFRETEGLADIDISFIRKAHEGCPLSPFDDRGYVLAHAFAPGFNKGGDIHFDDDEDWFFGGDNNEYGTNLEGVATHEIGHSLGMGHSDNRMAIMFPYYSGGDSLLPDDIQGIQSIYGPRRGPRPTTGPKIYPPRYPSYCNIRIDAIAKVDKQILVFGGQYMYTRSQNGLVDRKRISDVFRGGPSSVDAALYDYSSSKIFLFKGGQYWRFNSWNLDYGFPKRFGRDLQNIDAALMRDDKQFYIIKGNEILRWESGMESIPRYPGSDWLNNLSSVLRSGPASVDATFGGANGSIYVFQGNRYWEYLSNYGQAVLRPGYPKDVRRDWLKC